jgi:sodium/hydrogen antiporter
LLIGPSRVLRIGRAPAQVLVYAVASLTLVRMIPVAASLAGGGFSRASKLCLGSFGPRGSASIIFALVVVEEATSSIVHVVAVTATLSVFAHGLSAHAGAAAHRKPDRLRGRARAAPGLA